MECSSSDWKKVNGKPWIILQNSMLKRRHLKWIRWVLKLETTCTCIVNREGEEDKGVWLSMDQDSIYEPIIIWD